MINLSCQPRAKKFYDQAILKVEKREFLDAVDLLENASELEKDNLTWTKINFEIARLLRFEIQDYNKALFVYKNLILKSENTEVRLSSQQAIGEIYFENLMNYPLAIKELLLLETLVTDAERLESIRLKIAQSYRYIGNHKLALETIDSALRTAKNQKFHLLKLKAQTLHSMELYDEALKTYESILSDAPQFFSLENLFTAVSLIYEEKQDYKMAINYLTKYQDKIENKSYLELRLKRLSTKLVNKPFAKGVRK